MRLILRLVAVLAILVMVALPAAQVFNPAPVQAAWLTDYNYRKAISINGTADGDQTNYQMMLNVVADENGIPKSLVGTSTFANGWANNYWFQRKTLYMTGLTWAFYADGSNMVYKTSSDLGFSWNTTATIFATGARMGASTSLVFDGTHLHYAFNGAVDGEDLLYRMGTPDINGTITWATTEQTAVVIPAGWNSMYCNIIVQDDGYPQIGYCLKPADWPIHSVSAIVVRSSTDNGTWTTDAAFTKTLASGYVQMLNYPLGVALTGGKSYWAYAKDIIAAPYDYYYGDTWNGSAWVGEEPITDHVCAYGRYNLVSDGDNIHFASAGYDGATLKAYYYKRTYGIGWSSGVELIDSWSGGIGLTLTGSNSIIAAWTGAPTANHVYYRIMTNGVWASTVDWIDESVDTIPSTSSFQSMPSAIGTPYKLSVTYVTKAASPYSVIFKSLVQSDAGNVVNVSGTQADFDDIRFTKADGSTLLDYWLESKVNSQYANIWMKFDSIPNPGPTTFYVYYGYSAATASGNGTNTFPFFDDFDGTVLDPKWTLAGSGTATVASSKVTVLGPAPAGGWTTIRGNVSQSYGALRLKGSLNTTSFDKFGQSIDNAGTDATIFSVAPTPARNFSTWRAATATNTAITLTNDQLYTFDIIWKSGEIKAYQDGALVATHTTNLPTSAIPAEIGSYQNNAPAVVDWILLRNKTAIEPTFGTTGTKEGVPPTVTTQAVSSITSTTATSNGNITAIGSENATYQGIQWGLSSANYTTNVTTSGNFGIGAFTENLTGLPEGTTIHARAEAYNGFGWGYGDDVSFLTLPEVASFFSVAAGDGNITLSWTLGAGADNTTIRGNIGSYPATYADGVDVYNNTGTTYVHTPLLNGDHWYYRAWSSVTDNGTTQYSSTYIQGDATPSGSITTPTLVVIGSSTITTTTATITGNVTATGGENPTITVYWGLSDGGSNPAAWDNSSAPTSPGQPQGAEVFYKDLTGLPSGTTIYYAFRGDNAGGQVWTASGSFTTLIATPTNVAASDGNVSANITITWTKSTGAIGYYVLRDNIDISGLLGDVATYADTTGTAPVITAGTAVASDNTSTAYVSLSLSGTSIANGTTYTYKIIANGPSGNSTASATDTGYRGYGSLTYQWLSSDNGTTWANILGATTPTYNDTGASANGTIKYYFCILNATGAAQQSSTSDTGSRAVAVTGFITDAFIGLTPVILAMPLLLFAGLMWWSVNMIRTSKPASGPRDLKQMFMGIVVILLGLTLFPALLSAFYSLLTG